LLKTIKSGANIDVFSLFAIPVLKKVSQGISFSGARKMSYHDITYSDEKRVDKFIAVVLVKGMDIEIFAL
jgi:hypothetical protein